MFRILAVNFKKTLALAVVLLAFTSPVRASTCAAEPLVKGIALAFENAARTRSPRAFSSAAAHYADMRSVALFALGPYRAKLAPADEGHYVSLARGFLGRWMAENSTRISGAGLSIQTCSAQVVTGRFGNGSSVQFRLLGPRRVADISISGVSLAGILRSKFTDVIREKGGDINALLDYLEP